MRRAAGWGALALGAAALGWWWSQSAPPAPTPATRGLSMAAASGPELPSAPPQVPATPPPRPLADQDLEDRWVRYQAAFDSGDPAVVHDGWRAAQDCLGLSGQDLSGLESAALAAAPQASAPWRLAAARIAVARCGRFAQQPGVDEGMARLQQRLALLSVDHHEALTRPIDPQDPAYRAAFCRLYAALDRQPWLGEPLAFRVVGHTAEALQAQGWDPERAARVATLAWHRRGCALDGRCGTWQLPELQACALQGACGPGRPMLTLDLDPAGLDQARRVAEALAQAAAGPAACERHFFR